MRPKDVYRPSQKCTAHSKVTGLPCRGYAMHGTNVCSAHGGLAPQVKAAAARRIAMARARHSVEALGLENAADLNPLDVLETALVEIVALKDRLGGLVAKIEDEALRYPGRAGEQLRGELAAYQAMLRDTVKASETMVKLGLAERRVRIQEAEVLMLAEAIREILRRLNLTPEQKQISVHVVPEVLRALEAPKEI